MSYKRVEAKIRRLVRAGRYEIAAHVIHEKLAENYWSLEDLLSSIRSPTVIRHKADEKQESIDGKKYTIRGPDDYGGYIETVGKIMLNEDGEYYFVITTY